MSRDAVAAGEKQLASCSSEQRKYCSICTVIPGPCGDLPFTSWGLWQCLRGGAHGLNGCSAACGSGTEYRCWALLDGWRLQYIRHARSCRGGGQRATWAGQRAVRCEVQSTEAQTSNCEGPANGPASRRLLTSESRLLMSAAFIRGKNHRSPPRSQNPQFYVQPSSGFCWIPPCSAESF